MSVAWPQKTDKGLGPPGNARSADPYTESGERRARFLFATVGSCKTPIMGSAKHPEAQPRGESHRRLLIEGHRELPCKGLPNDGGPLCMLRGVLAAGALTDAE
jgi:hypothetical protein